MLDIKFVRENPEVVRENIRKKFQDAKLPLVDEVIELDKKNREIKQELQALQADRNRISKSIGKLMKEGKKEEAENAKAEVVRNQNRVAELSENERVVEEELKKKMMVIPNIIDPSVPIGKMTQRTERSRSTASLLFRILRSRIIPRSWISCTESIWTPQAESQATDSII